MIAAALTATRALREEIEPLVEAVMDGETLTVE